jgi:DNA-binding transcriptional LysR family regulator
MLTPDGDLLLSYAERLLALSVEASEALTEGRPGGPTVRVGQACGAALCPIPWCRLGRSAADVWRGSP